MRVKFPFPIFNEHLTGIIQTAAECVEVLKDMEITNDSTSRSLFERKMKQYENQLFFLFYYFNKNNIFLGFMN